MKRVIATASRIWQRRMFSSSTGFFFAFISTIGFGRSMMVTSCGKEAVMR